LRVWRKPWRTRRRHVGMGLTAVVIMIDPGMQYSQC
jgi:hypothetical protein